MKYLDIMKWVAEQIKRNPATTVALFSLSFNVMLVYYLVTREGKQEVHLLNCQSDLRGCQESREQQRDFYQAEMKSRYEELRAQRDTALIMLSRLQQKNREVKCMTT